MTKIRDLMTKSVETVSPTDTAQQAASFMLKADTGSIPVCDGDTVVGIITDRDIAVRCVGQGLGADTAVSDLMSGDIVCAREDDEVGAIAQRMSEAQVRRLPVLDSSDKLVGMISLGDLSRESEQAAAAQALEGVSAPGAQHNQG